MTQYLLGIAQQAPASSPGGGIVQFLPLVLIFGVFYFLIIMPQQKKAKQHQRLLSEIKKGDEVVTQGGIIGQVTGVKDDELVIQIQEGVRMRVRRSSVSEKYVTASDKKAAAAEKPAS